jgi:hypothetical protein
MLHVDRWTDQVPVDDTWVYTRVPSLLTAADLHGTWRAFGRQAGNDGSQHATYDLRIGEECSYRREYRDEADDVEPLFFTDAIGPCEVDLEELRVAFVVSRVDTDPKSSWGVVGNTLTFAIAPIAEETTSVIVSGFWNEQTYNSATGEWELGNADFPYGQYDFLMMRVDQ